VHHFNNSQLPARGVFTVQGSMDAILDQLVQSCGELKAKVHKIDREKHEIYGKSKTSWLKWGSEFHVAVAKVPAGILVAVEDLSPVPDDRFIKDLHANFSKRVPSSPLTAGVVNRTSADSDLDRRQDLVMPGGGAPDMVADIPDDNAKRLPQAKVCKKCGTSNSPDNDRCSNCGSLLIACQNCGNVPEEGMSFCTKCGHPLN
jgi:hypothetical protein